MIGDTKGALNLAMPAFVLEAMGLNASHGWQRRQSKEVAVERDAYYRRLGTIPLPVTAVVESTIAAPEVLRLDVGDIVSLGAPAETEVEVHVSGTPKFRGQLFAAQNSVRLRIDAVHGT